MAHSALIALILVAPAAADKCVSSASWTKRDEPRKDCAWVGRLPEKRCDVRGAAPAGSDAAYLLARDACPAQCDPSCAPEWGGRPWRAHNFVNEQTQVTRCGSQECGWGSWTTPAAAHEPVGVYRNPWFMTYANAEKRWKHADE